MAAQEDAAELNEVVVAQDFTPAEPEKGMRAFERYIKKNKNYPDAAKESSITGDVVLRISITAAGSIGRIEVAKSLGYGCDEEAIRLIREGGTWIPASRGGSAVADTISFTVSFEP